MTYDNLTAINTRKRYLQRLILENSHGVIDTLEKELLWLSLLFNSPLPKQTKSSMLWQHRIWVYNIIQSLSSSNHNKTPLVIDITKEIDLVIRANNLHPRNYYAWSYGRRLPFSSLSNEEFETVLANVFQNCKLHASDISCWSFLAFLLTNTKLTPRKVIQLYLNQIMLYIEIVGMDHESVWTAVRLIVVYQVKVLETLEGYNLVMTKIKGKPGTKTIEKWLSMISSSESTKP